MSEDMFAQTLRENGRLTEQIRLIREENESLVAQVRDLEANIAARRCKLEQESQVVRHVPYMIRELVRHGLRGKALVAELDAIAQLCERTAWPDGVRCPHCSWLAVSPGILHMHVMREHRTAATPSTQQETPPERGGEG